MSCTIPTTNPLAWTAPDGAVNALAMGAEGLWVGGEFHTIGGATRHGIAVLDPATGLATAWESGAGCPGDNVTAMALDSSRVYLSGNFEAGHTSPATWNNARNFFIALDRATGAVDSFDLNPSAGRPGLAVAARSIAVASDVIYIAGDAILDDVNGYATIVAFDLSTGLPLAGFNPQEYSGVVLQSTQNNGIGYAVALDGGTVYLANWAQLGAGMEVEAYDRYTGAKLSGWNAEPDAGFVQSNDLITSLCIDSTNGILYLGGQFDRAIVGPIVPSSGGRPFFGRSRITALDLATGVLLPWSPSVPPAPIVRDDSEVAVVSLALDSVAGRLYYGGWSDVGYNDGVPGAIMGAVDTTSGDLAWAPVVSTGVPAPHWKAAACAFDPATCRVFFGGTFTIVGGTPSPYLAAFAP